MANTTTKTYQDGDPLLEDDLDNLYENLQPSIDNLALATTGATSGYVLSSTGSGLAPAFISADTVAANITSTGADAIAADITSTGADDIALSMTSSGANYIGATISAASVCNYIGTTMTSTGANAIFGDIQASSSTAVCDAIGVNMTVSGVASVLNRLAAASSASQVTGVLLASAVNFIAQQVSRTSGSSVSHLGVAVSVSSGSYQNTTTTFTDVTNLSVTITTNGRPVKLELIPALATTTCYVAALGIGSVSDGESAFRFMRDATAIGQMRLTISGASSAGGWNLGMPPGVISTVEAVSAGTYTYTLQGKANNGNSRADVFHCKLVAYEL